MDRSEKANRWLLQAQHNLDAAVILQKSGFWDTCALMCQQTAELALKALWIDKQLQDPPRIHWIERLAADLDAPENVVDAALILVGDYMSSRYPDSTRVVPFNQYTVEDANDRIARAEVILNWVISQWGQ